VLDANKYALRTRLKQSVLIAGLWMKSERQFQTLWPATEKAQQNYSRSAEISWQRNRLDSWNRYYWPGARPVRQPRASKHWRSRIKKCLL